MIAREARALLPPPQHSCQMYPSHHKYEKRYKHKNSWKPNPRPQSLGRCGQTWCGGGWPEGSHTSYFQDFFVWFRYLYPVLGDHGYVVIVGVLGGEVEAPVGGKDLLPLWAGCQESVTDRQETKWTKPGGSSVFHRPTVSSPNPHMIPTVIETPLKTPTGAYATDALGEYYEPSGSSQYGW